MFRFFSGRGAQQEAASDAGEQRTEEDKVVTSHIQKMDNIIRWGGKKSRWYGCTADVSCIAALVADARFLEQHF